MPTLGIHEELHRQGLNIMFHFVYSEVDFTVETRERKICMLSLALPVKNSNM